MPYEFPDPRVTTGLPTEQDKFPYDKLAFQEASKPEMTPDGCSMAVTQAAYPKIYWYADNPRADLALKEFLNAIDFAKKGSPRPFLPFETKEPKKGRDGETRAKRSAFEKPWPIVIEGIAEEFREYLLWQQTFATQSRIVWNFVPFDPESLPWIIGSYQGNIVSDDKDDIAEALACLKLEVWKSTAIQNLVKRIRQSQGKTGHPIDSVVEMTKSWRLVYIETKNLENDKGAVWSLMGLPITAELSEHRELAAHIRNLRVRVRYQMLLNVDKTIGCDWCKNHDHPSHSCPFPEIDPAWFGPTTAELRLRLTHATVSDKEHRKPGTREGGVEKSKAKKGKGKSGGGEWTEVRRKKN
ncbi:hypothetical protein BDZ89DRAFT_1073624 [Hymenopellis radicata]|nr:hypothetical protein BDZ89DRAFT_1073624 [Hymenopellis radicata]